MGESGSHEYYETSEAELCYFSTPAVFSPRGGASGMSNGGRLNRWGDTAAGLGHRFAAAWVRVRAAFGEG